MRVITPSAYPTEPKPNQETAVVTESSHRAPLGRPSHGQRCCQARLPMFEQLRWSGGNLIEHPGFRGFRFRSRTAAVMPFTGQGGWGRWRVG